VPISALQCVGPAFEHAEQQLFRPFRWAQWWRLAIVVFLAGELGGGGCSYNIPSGPSAPAPTGPASTPPDLSALAQYLWLIALAVVAVLLLIVVFLAIGSVFRFILYQAVVERRCAIGPAWRRWLPAGLRFFLWQLVLLVATLVLIGAAIGMPLWFAYQRGWFSEPSGHVSDFLFMALAIVPFVMFVALTASVLRVLANDFAVPVMAVEDVGVVDAWRRARQRVVTSRKEIAVYLLVKILLAIAAAIGFGILGIVAMILLVIVCGIPVLLVALGLAAAGVGWNVFTIGLTAVAGIAFFVAVCGLMALIAVPRTVFFVAFSQHFVADRYPALAEWRSRAALASTV
jgi:hypothetical protein